MDLLKQTSQELKAELLEDMKRTSIDYYEEWFVKDYENVPVRYGCLIE